MLKLFFLLGFLSLALSLSQTYVALKDGEFNFPLVNDEDVEYKNGISTMYIAISQRCLTSFIFSGSFSPASFITVQRVAGISHSGEFTWTDVASVPVAGSQFQYDLPAAVCGSHWRFQVPASTDVSPWSGISFVGADPAPRVKRAISCEVAGNYDAECSAASEGALCLEGLLCGCKVDRDCYGNTDFPYCVLPAGYCDRCQLKNDSANSDHLFCQKRYPGYATIPNTTQPLNGEAVAPINFYRTVCLKPSANTPEASSGSCQRCNQAPLQNEYHFPTLGSNQGASGTFFCHQLNPSTPICTDNTYYADTNSAALYNASVRGSCGPCLSSALCARALIQNPVCNIQQGTCGPCGDNSGCVGTFGNNCQQDGSCFTCTSNADCGLKDKGGDEICNVATGICGGCTSNADCGGTLGNNCQADGQCLTCSINDDCINKDGGDVANQTLCNTTSGVCYSACKSNEDCVGSSGNNCQLDGTCKTCTVDGDCGALDGGQVPNEPSCNANTGICVYPFNCTTNANCSQEYNNTLPNCQSDGTCIKCTDNTCAFDGGEQAGQPNCNTKTGLCQSKCNTDLDCIDTVGANCGSDGICRDCSSNSDCSTWFTNASRSICNASGFCGPCTSNAQCTEGGRHNCGTDGSCFNCSVASDGCARDLGNNPHCDPEIGICVSGCTLDEHCPLECTPRCLLSTYCCVECVSNADCPHPLWKNEARNKTTCSRNDNKCFAGCSSDADCLTDSAPACSVHTGTCVQCQSDANCGGSQPACDSNTGQCVQCSVDAHCVEFGLHACSLTEQKCVRCTSDAHCNSEELNKQCDVGSQTCVQCTSDSHCGEQDKNKRCDAGAQHCVQCLADIHCTGSGYCDTASQQCVPCVYDNQCGDGKRCDKQVCVEGGRGFALTTGAIVGIAIAAAVIFAMLIAIIVLSVAMRKRISYETQPLMA